MRVYLSGPMTGLPDCNFPAFHAAAAAWRSMGWDVANPAESFGGDATLPYLTYCRHDVKLLKTCDLIAVLPGWDAPTARGSLWEVAIAAELLKLPIADALAPFPLPTDNGEFR
jgi:hypothetical protein